MLRPPRTTVRYRRHIGIVGGFALLLGAFIALALLVLWLFLADYQRSLPKNLAEQVFSAYHTGDVKTISEYSVNLPEPLKNPTLFTKYYADNTNLDNLYFYPGSTGNPAEACYEFVSGSDPVATLILRQTKDTSLFGFAQYEISSIIGYPLTDYRITAPRDTMLFADGKLLSEQYRTDEQSSVSNFVPLSNTVFQTKTYVTTDFIYIDELIAFGIDGSDCTVTWSEDRRTATVDKSMSAEQQAEIHTFAEQFSEAYGVFATKRGGARNPVVQLLQPGTPFHRALMLYSNEWGEVYSTDRYENRVIDRFVRYSPTEFSCDIQFTYVIQFKNGMEKPYPYSMTYYLTSQSGRLALVDMQPQPK